MVGLEADEGRDHELREILMKNISQLRAIRVQAASSAASKRRQTKAQTAQKKAEVPTALQVQTQAALAEMERRLKEEKKHGEKKPGGPLPIRVLS